MLFKNMIIEQNKVLLRHIAEKTGLEYSYLEEKYIRPEYYLPIIHSKQLTEKKYKPPPKQPSAP